VSGNLIYPECPICGNAKNFTHVLDIGDLKVVECLRDKLLMFRPNVSIEEHNKFLNEDFFIYPEFQKARQSDDYSFEKYLVLLNSRLPIIGYPDYLEPEHLRAKISWGRRCLSWFVQYSQGKSLKTVVDVGCSTGHMVQDFVRIGRFDKAVGIDVSPWIINQGKKLLKVYLDRGKLDLFVGECWEYKSDINFDCVIFWDSIEHVQHPNKALSWVKDHTVSGSMMIVHTPDVDCARMDTSWYLWSPKQHCFFYSRSTLDMLLAKYKFYRITEKVSPENGEMLLIYHRRD